MLTTQNSTLKDNNNPDRFNLHGVDRNSYTGFGETEKKFKLL